MQKMETDEAMLQWLEQQMKRQIHNKTMTEVNSAQMRYEETAQRSSIVSNNLYDKY